MTSYRLAEGMLETSDTGASAILARAHAAHDRPLCLCCEPHPQMYVARSGQNYIVKRMPNTGALHAPVCDSYEPPAELSGLGEVAGSAIKENIESGITTLKLDFSLSKMGARKAPAQGVGEADTVRTDGKKLTLRGFLHLLWSDSGFNRWAPAMDGKRNWNVIRRYLLESLADKEAKGEPLAGSIYIPETFRLDDKEGISARRSAHLAQLTANAKGGGKKLMLLIGEVKDIEPSRYGYKIVAKHLPDYPFMLNADIHKRLFDRFGTELAAWRADGENHLIVVGTFGVGPTGYASVEEASLMLVTPQWLPFEDAWEAMLLRALVDQKRHFVKGLRFNLPRSKPLACAVTSDTAPLPVAMYVLPDADKPGYDDALRELVAASQLSAWFWQPGSDGALPALPDRQGYASAALPAGNNDEGKRTA